MSGFMKDVPKKVSEVTQREGFEAALKERQKPFWRRLLASWWDSLKFAALFIVFFIAFVVAVLFLGHPAKLLRVFL